MPTSSLWGTRLPSETGTEKSSWRSGKYDQDYVDSEKNRRSKSLKNLDIFLELKIYLGSLGGICLLTPNCRMSSPRGHWEVGLCWGEGTDEFHSTLPILEQTNKSFLKLLWHIWSLQLQESGAYHLCNWPGNSDLSTSRVSSAYLISY